MSLNCTLHPIDPRLIRVLAAKIRGERADWGFFRRLWKKNQRLQQINQSFKDGLKEVLEGQSGFDLHIHLWGRPFFITAHDAEAVTARLDQLYGLEKERDIAAFFMAELNALSETAYRERIGFPLQKHREPDLGLNRVLVKLRRYYRRQQFEELASELGFILAQLAAVAYPWWQMESYALTYLWELQLPHWQEEPEGLRGAFTGLGEIGGYLPERLNRSLSGGIYLNGREIETLLQAIRLDESYIRFKMAEKQFSERFCSNFLQKTTEALTYARFHGFGLLEASDVYEKFPKRYP